MEKNLFQKRAVVFGNFEETEFIQATELLRNSGYEVKTLPVEGMLEINVYPTENRTDARRLSPAQLKKFLNGEHIPHNMHTII